MYEVSEHIGTENDDKGGDDAESSVINKSEVTDQDQDFEMLSKVEGKIKKSSRKRKIKNKKSIKIKNQQLGPNIKSEIVETVKKEDDMPLNKDDDKEEIKIFPLKKRGMPKGTIIRGKLDRKSQVILGNCKCPLCNQEFTITDFHSERNYRNHVFCHGVRRFNCECEQNWESQRSLKLHVYLAHRGNFHCTKCREVFHTDEELEAHMKKHVRNDPLVCVDCGYTTLRDTILHNHVMYYHDTEKHICEICCKEFTGRLKMMIHKRRFHAQKKPCPLCGSIVKSLWLHKKNMHTDDATKKYQCEICAKGFIEKGKLEIHMTSVHVKNRPYVCRYNCGVASNEKGNRKKHEISKHGQEWQ